MPNSNGRTWKLLTLMTTVLVVIVGYVVANDVNGRARDIVNAEKVAEVDKAAAVNTESIKYIGEEVKEFKMEQRTFNSRMDLKLDRILAK